MLGGIHVKGSTLCSGVGDNIAYPCPAGHKLRLYFFGYSAGPAVTGVLVQLKLQNAVRDSQYLVAPGQPYARNIQAGTERNYIEGNSDENLVVNLSVAQGVYVNYELEVI